jgi:molecular chaperone DnaK (HSP70)
MLCPTAQAVASGDFMGLVNKGHRVSGNDFDRQLLEVIGDELLNEKITLFMWPTVKVEGLEARQ